MNYNLLADAIVLIHFAWILLMIIGFLVTLYGFRKKEIFDWLAFLATSAHCLSHIFSVIMWATVAFTIIFLDRIGRKQ